MRILGPEPVLEPRDSLVQIVYQVSYALNLVKHMLSLRVLLGGTAGEDRGPHRRRGSAAAVFGNTSGDGSSCLQGQPGITRPQDASGRRQEMSARRASVISSGTCGHAASELDIGVEYLSHRKTMINARIASTHDQRPPASLMQVLPA